MIHRVKGNLVIVLFIIIIIDINNDNRYNGYILAQIIDNNIIYSIGIISLNATINIKYNAIVISIILLADGLLLNENSSISVYVVFLIFGCVP